MKKSVVFAMAMALGISATAFAANPFSDLPAGHWAYGAVAKLAAAGVVDGYPDGTFKGDRTMTRYEMAQIVAKALAKGAIGADDKLVSEFADELDNLGVRVAKLEKNADNVKITGNFRAHHRAASGSRVKTLNNAKFDDRVDRSDTKLRSRLWFTGEVNDNWHYVGMLENVQNLEGKNESGDGTTQFQRAYLTGNIGAVNLTAGRFNDFIADGNVFDDRADAVRADVKFGQGYLSAAYGKMANNVVYGADNNKSVADKYWSAALGGRWGNLHAEATYTKVNNQDFLNGLEPGDDANYSDNKIWTVGADYQAGKLNISAMYLKGDADKASTFEKDITESGLDDDGYVFGLNYAGAENSKPGSWGLYAKYYDQSAQTVVAHTMNGDYYMFPFTGFKGYMFGGNLAVAKNMIATVEYYDLKDKNDSAVYAGKHARTLWSELTVTF